MHVKPAPMPLQAELQLATPTGKMGGVELQAAHAHTLQAGMHCRRTTPNVKQGGALARCKCAPAPMAYTQPEYTNSHGDVPKMLFLVVDYMFASCT